MSTAVAVHPHGESLLVESRPAACLRLRLLLLDPLVGYLHLMPGAAFLFDLGIRILLGVGVDRIPVPWLDQRLRLVLLLLLKAGLLLHLQPIPGVST